MLLVVSCLLLLGDGRQKYIYICITLAYMTLYVIGTLQCISGQTCSVSQTGQIRLSKTSTVNLNNSGRVEICIGGVWGTIAADSVAIPWSEKNAQVACIELGYSGALNSIFQRTYVQTYPSTSTSMFSHVMY